MRWVNRNEDKPHRCPECHAVAMWDNDKAGPRTLVRCPLDCNVQWRYGRRWQKHSMRVKQILDGKYQPEPLLYWYTVQRFGLLNR